MVSCAGGSEYCRIKVIVTTSSSASAISASDFTIIGFNVDAHGPYLGNFDEPVQFTGSAENGTEPYSWHWDFGDGETSDEQNPAHTYDTPGNYTVVLSVTDNEGITVRDTTWAWIQGLNNPPDKPTIAGPTKGNVGEKCEYTFSASDLEGSNIWYYIDWGDGTFEDWTGPYASDEKIYVNHSWSAKGTYIIGARAKDIYGAIGEWGYLEVTMPKNKPFNFNFNLLEWLFERFPNAFPVLRQLLRL